MEGTKRVVEVGREGPITHFQLGQLAFSPWMSWMISLRVMVLQAPNVWRVW